MKKTSLLKNKKLVAILITELLIVSSSIILFTGPAVGSKQKYSKLDDITINKISKPRKLPIIDNITDFIIDYLLSYLSSTPIGKIILNILGLNDSDKDDDRDYPDYDPNDDEGVIELEKLVRIKGKEKWDNEVEVNVGTEVEFSLVMYNFEDLLQKYTYTDDPSQFTKHCIKMEFTDYLPKEFKYVEGSIYVSVGNNEKWIDSDTGVLKPVIFPGDQENRYLFKFDTCPPSKEESDGEEEEVYDPSGYQLYQLMLRLIRLLSDPDNMDESGNWNHFRFVYTAETVSTGYSVNRVELEGNNDALSRESFSFGPDTAKVNIR